MKRHTQKRKKWVCEIFCSPAGVCAWAVRRPSGRLGALFHVKLFARLGAFGGVWGRGVSVRVASVSIPFTLRRFGERSDFIQPGYLQ